MTEIWRHARIWAAALAFSATAAQAQMMDFAALDGWGGDDPRGALQAFRETCDLLDEAEWGPLCRMAPHADTSPQAARAFFEMFFRPVLIGTPPALFTGYFEPDLNGSPVRTPEYAWPVYRRPPELADGMAGPDRRAIEAGALSGRGLELAWLADPVDLYFLQIQGSGRVTFPNGQVIRLGYGGTNGQAFRPVAATMMAAGFDPADLSAAEISTFVRRNPATGANLLNSDPSYVFFRKLADLPPEKGPLGAMSRPLTAMRTVAVDPDRVPLGAPVWIEKDGRAPWRRLMVAQDTGGAIKGAQRADLFLGTGEAAGDLAGQIHDPGRMIVLLPIEAAYAMWPEG